MATGDQTDVTNRLLAVLPPWFPAGASPILTAVLQGPAWVGSFIYGLIQYARAQTRIATATGGWLDLVAYDFFGYAIQRTTGQSDASLRAEIQANLFPPLGTKAAIVAAVLNLTGRAPVVLDAWHPGDMGAYGIGTLAYDTAGSYGSLVMPGEMFITAYRPNDGVHVATDAQIYAAIATVIAAGATAWTRIEN